MTPKTLWITGWAIPPVWFSRQVCTVFPDDPGEVRLPGPDCFEGIHWSGYDRFVGYSFGAFWLLQNAPEGVRDKLRVIAPFSAFCAEAGRGGRVLTTQVKVLRRWLAREPLAALGDFYARAGVSLTVPTELPAPVETLLWGLDMMAAGKLPDSVCGTVPGVIGASDALLDAARITAQFAGVKTVPGTHDLLPLLRALKQHGL
ncbi:MAG: hypothetical protein SFY92_05765 [Verrucomicrobiae bacterium]|nr:hypothetical protein [Verrucomicrobiae bacterium]